MIRTNNNSSNLFRTNLNNFHAQTLVTDGLTVNTFSSPPVSQGGVIGSPFPDSDLIRPGDWFVLGSDITVGTEYDSYIAVFYQTLDFGGEEQSLLSMDTFRGTVVPVSVGSSPFYQYLNSPSESIYHILLPSPPSPYSVFTSTANPLDINSVVVVFVGQTYLSLVSVKPDGSYDLSKLPSLTALVLIHFRQFELEIQAARTSGGEWFNTWDFRFALANLEAQFLPVDCLVCVMCT